MTTAAVSAISEEQLDAALKALASAPRREIVRFLVAAGPREDKTCCGRNEMCSCKISDHLGLAASTVSHHMSALVGAGLVTARKDGTWVYYTVRHDVLAEVAEALKAL